MCVISNTRVFFIMLKCSFAVPLQFSRPLTACQLRRFDIRYKMDKRFILVMFDEKVVYVVKLSKILVDAALLTNQANYYISSVCSDCLGCEVWLCAERSLSKIRILLPSIMLGVLLFFAFILHLYNICFRCCQSFPGLFQPRFSLNLFSVALRFFRNLFLSITSSTTVLIWREFY